MKYVFGLLLMIHGLIHLMGFARAFRLATIEQFTREITKPVGLLWLVSGLLFLVVTALFLMKRESWPLVAIIAVVLSQILILFYWQDARFGTIANVIIAGVAISSFVAIAFANTYRRDVRASSSAAQVETRIIREEDLDHLPAPVQKYLRYVGVVGKTRVQDFRIVFEGDMRGRDQDWFPFTSEQFNFIPSPTRLFFMKARVKGLPAAGYHRYKNGNASMRVKVLSLFPVVHIDDPALYPTETVTFFNDLCLFAPAGLIDRRITWEPIDHLTARATFTTRGTSISAELYFNDQGQLVNFVSEDRIAIDEMKTFPFSTPVKDYQKINGLNLPTYGEAVWHYPDGAFVYGKFRLQSVDYNQGGGSDSPQVAFP